MPNHVHMIISIESTGRTEFAPTIAETGGEYKERIKRMKKIILLFALMFVLTSCTPASDPDNLFGSVIETETAGTLEVDTVVSNNSGIITDPMEIPYIYTTDFNKTFCDTGSTILFFWTYGNNNFLYEYDKATGHVEYFCKDAVCKHSSENCVAYGITGGFELFNGTVYAKRSVKKISANYDFMTVELKNGRFFDTAGPVLFFWHYGSWMYALADGGTFVRFPVSGGSHEILLEETVTLSSVIIEDYIYARRTFNDGFFLCRINLSDGNYELERIVENLGSYTTDGEYFYFYKIIKFGETNTDVIYRCNLDGSEIIETPIKKASLGFDYDDEYIYYCGYDPEDILYENYGKIYRIKKTLDEEEEFICETNRATRVYTVYKMDEIFLFNEDGVFMVGKDGSNFRQLELP